MPSAWAMPSTVMISAPSACTAKIVQRLHRAAVEIDGAGAAMAGLAADMRAREVQFLAQEVDRAGCAARPAPRPALPLTVELDDVAWPCAVSSVAAGAGERRGDARARSSRRRRGARYSAGPRTRRPDGIASAALAAALAAAASSRVPTSACAGRVASMGSRPRLVSAMDAWRAAARRTAVRTTAAAAVA